MEPLLLDPLDALLALVDNHSPLATALYPDLDPKQATAKYHSKRMQVRGRKFSDDERQRLREVVLRKLQPIAEAYSALTLRAA